MRLAYAPFGLSLALAACAAQLPPASPRPAATVSSPRITETVRELDLVAVVERAMPAVVLVLNTGADGQTRYGAGLFIEPALILTSQHVIAGARTLSAMLYRAGRNSYTPMDGGLSRYLFENQSDIVTAYEVDGDSTSDLALLRLDADTSGQAPLPIARDPVRPGDRVLALGHPQESVWSFTQGVVGSIEQGAIQHDAAISHGSSGGPLLNARGEVVGINIARVMGEATGLAFARPISLAARYLGESSVAARPLDLSTPEAAAVSCWRAQEMGSLEVGECFDWEASWAVFSEIANEAERIAPPPLRARLSVALADPNLKQRWIERGKRKVAAYFVEGGRKAQGAAAALGPMPPEVAEAHAQADREREQALRFHPELRGMYGDQDDPSRLMARLRLGIRVDRVTPVGNDRAWVQLAGRNPDGSLYRFSELYVKLGGRWLQRSPPLPRDIETLPSSFAPLLLTLTGCRARRLEELVRNPESLFEVAAWSARPARPARPEPSKCTTADC